MKIARAEIYQLNIPFKLTFSHSKASRSESDGIVLCIKDEEGLQGWGECAPREYVTGETTEIANKTIQRMLSIFFNLTFNSFEEVVHAIHEYLPKLERAEHAAFCAIELALLDLAGKSFKKSCAELIGPQCHEVVKYSAVLTAGDVKAAKIFSEMTKKFGIQSVKVKVGVSKETDLKVLDIVREILGDKCGLRVDANCAWNAEEALTSIEAYAPYNLQGIEQPLEAQDIDGFVWLTERSSVPIIVDESLVSFDDAKMLAERHACNVFNIRVSKCGGLCNSTRIRNYAIESGIQCMLGSQVGETAILSAAGRQFATHSSQLLFLEGSFGSFLLESDVAQEDLTFGPGGKGNSISGYGMGITIIPEKVSEFATQSFEVK